MYSYKEKIKHYRDLSAPDHVLIDLEHLRKVDPRNEHLPSFENAPARNADKILYALLDLVSAEDIRNYRRQVILDREAAEEEAARLKEEENARKEAERLAKVEIKRLAAEKAAAEKKAQEEAERIAAEKTAAEKAAREEAERVEKEKVDTEKAAQEEAERLAAEKAQLEEQLEETEFERDEAIEEKEDLEEKLADTETELEEVKAELEEEKKSEVKPVVKVPAKPANSKKKTNTQASGGKTSKTKTSK